MKDQYPEHLERSAPAVILEVFAAERSAGK